MEEVGPLAWEFEARRDEFRVVGGLDIVKWRILATSQFVTINVTMITLVG